MVNIKHYQAGFCRHPNYIVTNTFSLKIEDIPLFCTLIKHPLHGYILFDTGYNQSFFDATKKFPYSLYKKVTPITITKTLKDRLLEDTIDPSDINFIFISHFHADHICAINDFPNAIIICSQEGYKYATEVSGLKGLTKGILPDLIKNFASRTFKFIEHEKSYNITESYNVHFTSYNLFDDKSLIAVSLPGHAAGHYGLWCNIDTHNQLFLVGDAYWKKESLINNKPPHNITKLLFHHHKQYINTLNQLHTLHKNFPEITITSSHENHYEHE